MVGSLDGCEGDRSSVTLTSHGLSYGWAGCGFRRRLGSLKGLTDDCGLPLEQTFDGLAQILQQMPAIDDLLCLGCCIDGRLGVGRPAVPADEFDARMIVEPLLDGFGIAVGQEIDHVAPLKIHDDGAVPLAFEPGPVVDPNEAGRRRGVVLEPLDASEQRVWAGGHGEENGQAGAGFASESKPNRSVGLAEAVGCTSIRPSEPLKSLGKEAARAFGPWAKESSDRDLQPDRQAETGQVSEAAVITAVNPSGFRAAERTRSGRGGRSQRDRDGGGFK